jgi:hypothetical protein
MSALDLTTAPDLHDGIDHGVTTAYANRYPLHHDVYAFAGARQLFIGVVRLNHRGVPAFSGGRSEAESYELPAVPGGWHVEARKLRDYSGHRGTPSDAPDRDDCDGDRADAEAERHFRRSR